MGKLYKVTFTHFGKQYSTEVEADCEKDAIDTAEFEARMSLGFTENHKATLIADDNEYFV